MADGSTSSPPLEAKGSSITLVTVLNPWQVESVARLNPPLPTGPEQLPPARLLATMEPLTETAPWALST